MRRLIDADMLGSEFHEKCVMECGCCQEATTNHHNCAISCGLVDNAPVIDAIPVEWIKARWKRMCWDSMTCKTERELVREWENEQGAME